jgi:hypothetical protein
LSVEFNGAVTLESSAVFGNRATGGKGAAGGWGLVGTGASGSNAVGLGGGICDFGVPGGSVSKSANTIVLGNLADIDPDIFGLVVTIRRVRQRPETPPA